MSLEQWWLATRARLAALVGRRRAENDLSDELTFHLAMETAANVARGLPRDEAERRARLALGGMEQAKELGRDVRPLQALANLAYDSRQTIRTLWRAPAFTWMAIATLTLGMAAAVFVFVMAKAVLLTPLPFPDSDRLVMVWERSPAGDLRNFANGFNVAQWQARARTLQSVGAIIPFSFNISGFGDAEQVDGQIVSSGFFTTLGVRPLLGRTFTTADDSLGGPLLQGGVVLSYRFWQQRYDGAPDAIGRQLVVNGTPHEIIGVMPAGFAFPALRTPELYMLITLNPSGPPGGRSLVTVARLKPGVTIDAARADMARIMSQLAREAPRVDRGWGASVFPLFDETVAPIRTALWVIFGAVACLLLLACANVANLLLMRMAQRAPQFALRGAIGASRSRMLHLIATESFVIALSACVAALALARMAVPVAVRVLERTVAFPRAQEIRVDTATALWALLVAALIALVLSILQASTRLLHGGVGDLLKAATRTMATAHPRLRRALVVSEMAVALVLVFAATLTGRSLAELYRINPGFKPDHVLTVRMALIPRKYVQPARGTAFVARLLDEVRATPGVIDASSIHFLPLSGSGSGGSVFRSDRPKPADEAMASRPMSVVAPHYFSTMGIPLRGRDFDERDRLDTPKAVIINEALAREYFPGENPIGKALKVRYSSDADYQIIGIAGDVRTGTLNQAPGPAVYLTESQEPSLNVALVVRTTGSPDQIAGAVRHALSRVDPEQGVKDVAPLDDVIAGAIARPRVEAGLFGIFGILGLLIAAIGVYAVIAYGVEQRRREIGILLALGAAPSAVLRGVLREGLGLGAIGVVIGACAAVAAGRFLRGLLYGTSTTDPVILAGAIGVLLAVAVVASLAPARRATRVDPLIVLRAE